MIRPYLIARKENLSFSSQLAVWAVERFLIWQRLPCCWRRRLPFAPATRALLHYFRIGNLGTIALGIVAAVVAIFMVWKGDRI